MGDDLTTTDASTTTWKARCKDCQAEQRAARYGNKAQDNRARGKQRATERKQQTGATSPTFEYSRHWAVRTVERGGSRSDRCERHRKAHRMAIQALAVAYIDLQTIGDVADRDHPTGPLGGLGPLPSVHREQTYSVDLAKFKMGMSDSDILQLLRGLTEKRVAVLEAGTGTGKSTLMPFRLMNPPPGAAMHLNDFGPIVVTEPRKAAATGVAGFVGEAMCFGHDNKTCTDHVGPGFPVGYQVSGDRNWDSACQLIYVTDGTMINWVRDGRLAKIGTVIVDEAHERSENIDVILAQLRDQLQRHEHLRVIVTSATLNKDFFIEYFGGPGKVYHQYVEAQKSFGYGVPLFIETDINDDVIKHGLPVDPDGTSDGNLDRFEGWPERGPQLDGQPAEDLRATTRSLRHLRRSQPIPMEQWKKLMPEAVVQQTIEVAVGTEYGDILAFLPTKATIEDTVKNIKEGLKKRRLEFDVYPLLSTIPANIRDKAIAGRSVGEKRKIVVSSNLAETSLTVKGVRYIIDSGLICQSEWDPTLASGTFLIKPHSQSGVRQRWGRVGRDAPGWVFPLYTLEQFCSLPKSTSPGATQVNLETFYMKLISAGLDVDNAVLPANFTHENVDYDQDALYSIETFKRESQRARRALAAAGAVDNDGHLTDFGRELERFSGSGAQAVAIMLADQLACVHEVALVLAVLSDSRLLGGDQGIFRSDRDWPAAWRVHSARCHRALAAGCGDDLEILLRVFAEWQAADESNDWCATWWINQQPLKEAEMAVNEIIATLSPGMKGKADRSIMPELASRARAVITRAMGSLKYHRIAGNRYSPTGKDVDAVELSRSILVDPGDRIIAFNAFRLPPRKNGDVQAPIISNVVRIVDWAETGEAEPDDMGLDLIVRAANHLRDRADTPIVPWEIVAAIRQKFPIGSLVDLTVDERHGRGAVITHIKRVSEPFPYRDTLTGSSDQSTGAKSVPLHSSGFDPNWDPYTNPDPEIPEEEAALAILNPLELETNDAPVGKPDRLESRKSSDPVPEGVEIALPKLLAIPQHEMRGINARMRGEIVGYEVIDGNTIALVVEQVADGANGGDPARHDDLKYWSSVDLEVRGLVRDHEYEFVHLARVDGQGSFYLDSRTRGVDANDSKFALRLRPGARLAARVVPGRRHESVTITLLPSAIDHFRESPFEQHRRFEKFVNFYPATIVEGPNKRGKLVVELDYSDTSGGFSHRFEVREEEFERWGNLTPEIGQRLLVSIDVDRSNRRQTLSTNLDGIVALANSHADFLQLKDDKIRAARRELSLEVIESLLGLEKSEKWKRTVWRFFIDNLHLEIKSVRPVSSRTRLKVLIQVTPLLVAKKSEIGQRRDVFISVDQTSGVVKIVGTNPVAVKSAAEELSRLADLPFIVARLPANTTGKLIGSHGRDINELRCRSGVRSIEVVNNTVTVVGNSARTVHEITEEIRLRVRSVIGEMVVPAGKNGSIIGTRGAVINSLRRETKCRTENRNDGCVWKIEGPNKSAVQKFFQMARQQARGTTGRILEERDITIVEDRTEPPMRRSTAASRSTSTQRKVTLVAAVIVAVIVVIWLLVR